MCAIKLLIRDLPRFSKQTLNTMNLTLRSAFVLSHKFGYVVL